MAVDEVPVAGTNNFSILLVFRVEIGSKTNGKSKAVRNAMASRAVQWISGGVFCMAVCTGKTCVCYNVVRFLLFYGI